ncbi:hypothetical protein VM1G_05059 [Cytospora mali]|uniref:Uncharacterized protein n=1 Tax=Cytospora mali TaxID=578113 RepID=A0A194W000_CYTMA|nr:hypothetical protein VM1G_05059 [Valsa mali]
MSNTKHYYYIDSSAQSKAIHATRGQKFKAFVQAAQHWARRAVERLQDGNDTDFARVFNNIFKTPNNNPTRWSNSRRWQIRYRMQSELDWRPTINHVVAVLSDFTNNWTMNTKRQHAHVRFFSDDRARFRRAPNGMYYDTINHVYYPDSENWVDLRRSEAIGSSSVPGTDTHLPHINQRTRQSAWQGSSLDRDWDLIPGGREDMQNDFEDEDLDDEEMAAVASPWTEKWALALPYPPPSLNVNMAVRGRIMAYADIRGT